MELKDYQIKVLEYLDAYLEELKTQKDEKLDYFEFQTQKGKQAIHPEKSDYCQLAWKALKAKIAVYRPDYNVRHDGMDRNIPNICFKVPTGGGKRYLQRQRFNALIRIILSVIMALSYGLFRVRRFTVKPVNSFEIKNIRIGKC